MSLSTRDAARTIRFWSSSCPPTLSWGAGPTGRAAAHSLIRRNQQVKVGTRSRTPVPQCLSLRVDATDAAALATAATNCESIIVCVNPPYPEWPEEWPPIIESVIAAARATGSRIVLMGNLYPFGRQTKPFTGASLESPTEPKGATRAQLWRMLKQADDLYVTELRASDYFGPGAGIGSIVGDEFIEPILAGGVAKVVGDPTVPPRLVVSSRHWRMLGHFGHQPPVER